MKDCLLSRFAEEYIPSPTQVSRGMDYLHTKEGIGGKGKVVQYIIKMYAIGIFLFFYFLFL